MRRLFALTALLAVSAATAPGYHYWLDGPHSAVTAKVSYMGFGSKVARFPQMRGSIRLDPAGSMRSILTSNLMRVRLARQ